MSRGRGLGGIWGEYWAEAHVEMLQSAMRRGKKNSRARLDCLSSRLQGNLTTDYSRSRSNLHNTLSDPRRSEEERDNLFCSNSCRVCRDSSSEQRLGSTCASMIQDGGKEEPNRGTNIGKWSWAKQFGPEEIQPREQRLFHKIDRAREKSRNFLFYPLSIARTRLQICTGNRSSIMSN
jgi:hypothetical protein